MRLHPADRNLSPCHISKHGLIRRNHALEIRIIPHLLEAVQAGHDQLDEAVVVDDLVVGEVERRQRGGQLGPQRRRRVVLPVADDAALGEVRRGFGAVDLRPVRVELGLAHGRVAVGEQREFEEPVGLRWAVGGRGLLLCHVWGEWVSEERVG